MSIRIHCSHCDTVFEPPEDVWSARCPFCSHETEVPRTHQGFDHGTFRRRYRRAPGWLVVLITAMPPWGGPALVASFFLLLASAFMQSWTAAHSDRSATAMVRAIKQLELSTNADKNQDLLKSYDLVLLAWTTESADELATKAGLKKEVLRKNRSELAQKLWQSNLALAVNDSSERGLRSIEELEQEALSDEDLKPLANAAAEAWEMAKSGQVNRFIATARSAATAGEISKALADLGAAINWQMKAKGGKTTNDPLPEQLRKLITEISLRNGLIVDSAISRTIFTDLKTATARCQPTIEKRLLEKRYAVFQSPSSEANRIFQENAPYRLTVRYEENYGRPYEDTPHRIGIINVQMALSKGNSQLWAQSAMARTPRNPAQTAMGLSRLQLSKNTDGRVERRFNEAAWETVPAALSQSLQLLPMANQVN
jgi:hypothetical protein